MTKHNFRAVVGAVALLSLFVWSAAFAAEEPGKARTPSLNRVAGSPRFQILNINNFTIWTRADGQGAEPPSGGGDGSRFPRGTRWAIYQDGMMWGGKTFLNAGYSVPSSQLIRVGGSTYNVGNQSGWIIGSGANATALPQADPKNRIYRIRRDWRQMSKDDLKKDAAEYFEKLSSDVTSADIDAVTAQYAQDWTDWPVDRGAPYIERNGTAGYQAPPANLTPDELISGNYDEPGVAGSDPKSPADQVVFTIVNDLNASLTQGLSGSDPMGLETQITLWGYKRTDALGNLYFKKNRMINKGGVDVGGGVRGSFYIDSMFVAQWSDPDLGAFGDDLSGCDTSLSMGFVYNGNAIDAEYRKFSLAPPAVGYDFLQGPIIASSVDSAVFDLKRRRGFKNLPMTSFAYFSAGSGISDPPFTREGGLRWWRMLQGFVPDPSTSPYRLYPFPPGETPSKFPLNGDPVRRTGFLDGLGTTYSFPPGDRRIVLNTGPFRLAPGDTQEVVVGVVGGLGADRLSSVSVMKFNDRFVQITYNALFQVPKSPAPPNVSVAELDGQVILDWGSDLQRVTDTETRVNLPGSYKFEGYNVYQLPSPTSSLSAAKRITTFDLPTDPTVVLDEQFDPKSGQILNLPVQFGSNSGIERFFNFKRDYIRDVDKIYNGQEYYLAVTAYSVATVPGFLPAALESELRVITARPKMPFGTTYGTKFGDTVKVTHQGVSDGTVRPIIIDPTKSTGSRYQVKFDTTGGVDTWKLVNVSSNRNVLTGETNQSGDGNYKVVEGAVFLKVEGPPPGMKAWSIPNGSRRWTWADGGGLELEGFNGAIGWTEPAVIFGSIPSPTVPKGALKNVLIKFAAASSSTITNGTPEVFYAGWDTATVTDPNFSYGYRYVRGGTNPPARPEFAPYLVGITANYGLGGYRRNTVPFSAWDVEANPPQRLAVGFLENNVATGLVDGRYWPPPNGAGIDNVSSRGREWFFIFATPYTGATMNPAYNVSVLTTGVPIMYTGTVTRRGGANLSAGDEFLILANHINTPQDVFEYTLPPPGKGAGLEKVSADRVGVYPNPYYAFNPAETNRLVRFVTFNNLPPVAKVRIFNIAGQLVRVLDKDGPSQFLRWDLNNQDNFPVASGIYIAHIELTLPADGSKVTKILKVAIIQEQEVLDVF